MSCSCPGKSCGRQWCWDCRAMLGSEQKNMVGTRMSASHNTWDDKCLDDKGPQSKPPSATAAWCMKDDDVSAGRVLRRGRDWDLVSWASRCTKHKLRFNRGTRTSIVINLALWLFSLRCGLFARLVKSLPLLLGGLGWCWFQVTCGLATGCHFFLKCMFEEKSIKGLLRTKMGEKPTRAGNGIVLSNGVMRYACSRTFRARRPKQTSAATKVETQRAIQLWQRRTWASKACAHEQVNGNRRV